MKADEESIARLANDENFLLALNGAYPDIRASLKDWIPFGGKKTGIKYSFANFPMTFYFLLGSHEAKEDGILLEGIVSIYRPPLVGTFYDYINENISYKNFMQLVRYSNCDVH